MAASRKHFWRDLLRAVVALAALGLVIKTWLVGGLLSSVVVASGSMAPHLLGPHVRFDCRRCGHEFVCNEDSLPSGGAANCSNCGAPSESVVRAERGDRVLVDRSAFLWRRPRRWEVVVFESPESPGELAVKRVAGLPGETVEIRAGKLLIGDVPPDKSLGERRATAIPVYALPTGDGDADDATSRWTSDSSSGWRFVDGRFVHEDAPHATAAVDWLSYRHQLSFRTDAQTDEPILDDSPCDAAESRLLNEVDGVMLRFRLSDTRGSVFLRAGSPDEPFTVELDFDARQAVLLRGTERVATAALAESKGQSDALWELLLAVHHLQLALGDRMLLEYSYEPQETGAKTSCPHLAVGASGRVSISELQVLRDIYYTPPPPARPGEPCQYHLGPDEYFLLGDNSPHSLDSRVWSRAAGIRSSQILGRALRWRIP